MRCLTIFGFLLGLSNIIMAEEPGPIVLRIEGFTTATAPSPQPSFATAWIGGLSTPPLIS